MVSINNTMGNLSDFNRNGVASIRLAEANLYSDLNLAMPIHPNRKDIIPLTDLAAIKQAVKNLVLTNTGEKLFRADIGGNITELLFENYSNYQAIDIIFAIKDVLTNYEPRIKNIKVQVTPTTDKNAIAVTIGYTINNIEEKFDLQFALNRIR